MTVVILIAIIYLSCIFRVGLDTSLRSGVRLCSAVCLQSVWLLSESQSCAVTLESNTLLPVVIPYTCPCMFPYMSDKTGFLGPSLS